MRHIGVSNFNVEQLRATQAIAPVETLQPPYSLIDREVEAEILPYCRAGRDRRDRLLADGLRPADRRDDARADRGAARRRLAHGRARASASRSSRGTSSWSSGSRPVAERHGISPGAVAVAWTLRNPAVHGAIVGFRRPDQVEPIVAAADLELSDDDVAEILGDA